MSTDDKWKALGVKILQLEADDDAGEALLSANKELVLKTLPYLQARLQAFPIPEPVARHKWIDLLWFLGQDRGHVEMGFYANQAGSESLLWDSPNWHFDEFPCNGSKEQCEFVAINAEVALAALFTETPPNCP